MPGVVPDAPSALRRAWCILTQVLQDGRLWSSTTPQTAGLNQWPGSESNVYCFLQSLLSSVGCFHTSSTINAGNSTETQGGCLAKETKTMIKGVHLLHDSVQSHSAATAISWPPGAGKFFHIHHTVLICTIRLPYILKDGKAPQRSVLPLQLRCSKRSQDRVTCPGHICFRERLD